MENTTNFNNKKTLFERLARIFFILYMISLYIFVDKLDTVNISRGAFVLYAGFAGLSLLQRKRFHIGKNMMIVYLTITWMYATTFWAYNDFYATDKMNTVWQVFLLFFLTYNLFIEDEDAHEFLMKCLYISGVSLLVYSVYTYGLSEVIEMMTQPGGVRLGREISQENTFGMMNATTVVVAFYYLIYKNRYKLFHLATIAMAFLFAMSSGSRKALLMICVAVLILVYKKYGIRRLYKVFVIAAVLILIFMMVIRLPMFEFIRHRLEMTIETLEGDGEGDSSSEVRYNMIIRGWELFKQRILIGYGANNFAVVSGYGVYSHNNFIEMLVDFGLIGFVLYYLIYVLAIKNLGKSKKNAGKALFAIFVVRLLMEVALVNYYSKQNWILLAFFLISEKVNETSTQKEESKEIAWQPIEQTGETIHDYVEEKEGIYDSEDDDAEIEESYSESEDSTSSSLGEGKLCPDFRGQDISEAEILVNNGKEIESGSSEDL